MSHDAVEFVLKAVEMVAEHGWKLLPQVHKKKSIVIKERYVNPSVIIAAVICTTSAAVKLKPELLQLPKLCT